MSGNKARHTQQNHSRVSYSISSSMAGLAPATQTIEIVQTFFADLVVLAEEFHPIPFRTRQLKPPAPMVLRRKTRESRSLPGLLRTFAQKKIPERDPALTNQRKPRERNLAGLLLFGAENRERSRAREISRGLILASGSPGLAARLGARRCGVRPGKRSTGPFADPASPHSNI